MFNSSPWGKDDARKWMAACRLGPPAPTLRTSDETVGTLPPIESPSLSLLRCAASLALLSTLIAGCVPDAGRGPQVDAAYLAVVAAEDARPSDGRDLELLRQAARHADPALRRAAVRALGRLESPALAEAIAARLADTDPGVRQIAVNAHAQAYNGRTGDDALPVLLARVPAEGDPAVRGALARSLGRLALSPESRGRAVGAIVEISRPPDGNAPIRTLVGVALGLEAAVRQAPEQGVGAAVATRLEELSRVAGPAAEAVDAARIRGLALSALGQARRLDRSLIAAALDDEDGQVGAVALRFLSALPAEQRSEILERAVGHPSALVGIEAFRFMARMPRTATTCRHLLEAIASGSDRPAAVRVVAIDALAVPCGDLAAQRAALGQIASGLGSSGSAWQPAAHALVALASVDADVSRELLAEHARHANPFVRAYAARAAGLIGNDGVLRALAEDDDPNVRTAALGALFEREGHAIDALLLAQLEHDDPQLLLTVTALLEGSPLGDRVAQGALDALDRVSAAERETWRDSRRALLALAVAAGDERLADRIEPYLLDYDPLLAADAAEAVETWTGAPALVTPVPLASLALPTVQELRAMDHERVVLHMRDLGTIEIELHPRLATTNAYRFWRLARDGYFDGLTFHRWAPNFVIQGGSPGANEYQGDGAFTRDEVGLLPHWRGTIGISTRGHDTGDGQIFVNLMDNVRLDHTYTIIGTVVGGMDVVDGVLEGAVIERAEVVGAR
jgi:cyclophilin family peptidyl-prolyl cis-trans isomerase/HEAT repeat protein